MAETFRANYIPLATERTKFVVRHLQLETFSIIDLINTRHPFDRKEADAWVVEDATGMHLIYCEGGRADSVELDYEEQMRITVEEIPPIEDQRAPR